VGIEHTVKKGKSYNPSKENPMRHAWLLPVQLCILLVLFCEADGYPKASALPQSPPPSVTQPSPATGKSRAWSVVVVSAQKYTWTLEGLDQWGPPMDAFNLVLELRFEYVGPEAPIDPPHVAVVNDQGERRGMRGTVSMDSSELDALDWLLSASGKSPTKLVLKTGARFGSKTPVTYYIANIPKNSADLKLVFGDVPPFSIQLTWMKQG
jgi:hypothetical protein